MGDWTGDHDGIPCDMGTEDGMSECADCDSYAKQVDDLESDLSEAQKRVRELERVLSNIEHDARTA